ncbi:YjcZ family sporulation protein [Lysinibacillus capsici]
MSYCNFNSYCDGDNGSGNSSTFVLIVVLFILLIIVGASFMC